MENGTAFVKGMVKRVNSNVVIKCEVRIAMPVASHITDGPVLDCKKDKRLGLPHTCLLAYVWTESVSVGNPDPEASSNGTMQCCVVHPCARPDLQIRIRH